MEFAMTGIEICLLVVGMICFAASFVVGNKNDKNEESATLSLDLSELNKEKIRKQVDEIAKNQIDKCLSEQMDNISEQMEAQLDKLSNTKILEFNEYAETVMKEINNNHNETIFLYDMLNEKAKEIKNTVKDVNIAKDQVIRMENSLDKNLSDKEEMKPSVASQKEEMKSPVVSQQNKQNFAKPKKKKKASHVKSANNNTNSEAMMDAMLANVMQPQEANKTDKPEMDSDKQAVQNSTDETSENEKDSINLQNDKTENNNNRILSLYKKGMSNKDIAKTLGLGVGEVKLVVDLYKDAK